MQHKFLNAFDAHPETLFCQPEDSQEEKKGGVDFKLY